MLSGLTQWYFVPKILRSADNHLSANWSRDEKKSSGGIAAANSPNSSLLVETQKIKDGVVIDIIKSNARMDMFFFICSVSSFASICFGIPAVNTILVEEILKERIILLSGGGQWGRAGE